MSLASLKSVIVLAVLSSAGLLAGSARSCLAQPAPRPGALTLPAAKEVDLNTAAAVDLLSAPTEWKLPDGPAILPPGAKTPLRGSIRLPVLPIPPQQQRGGLPEIVARCGGVAFTGEPSQQVLMSAHVNDLRQVSRERLARGVQTKVYRTSLRTGMSTGAFDLPPGSDVIAASGDGTLVLVTNDSFGHNEKRVDLFRLPAKARRRCGTHRRLGPLRRSEGELGRHRRPRARHHARHVQKPDPLESARVPGHVDHGDAFRL